MNLQFPSTGGIPHYGLPISPTIFPTIHLNNEKLNYSPERCKLFMIVFCEALDKPQKKNITHET